MKETGNGKRKTNEATPKGRKPDINPVSDPRVVTVDVERYQHFLDESDLTDDEKQQVMQALWGIIVNFVDLGFGVHPVQAMRQVSTQEKEKTHAPLKAYQLEGNEA